MLTNFIKTGNPSPQNTPDTSDYANFTWPNPSKSTPHTHVKLHKTPKIHESFDEEVIEFWGGLIKEFGDSVIRNIHFGEHEEGLKHEEL